MLGFKRKYEYYSTLCAIAKNEDDYIEEWVDHHLSIGFDHICIYDNNDGYQLHDILKSYLQAEKVTLVDYRGLSGVQLKAYEDFVAKYRGISRWGAFLDVDEFIVLEEDESIDDLLKNYEEFGALALSWMGYGANGNIWETEGKVADRFPSPAMIRQEDIGFSVHVKSIVQLRDCQRFDHPHAPILKRMKACNVKKEKIAVGTPHMIPCYQRAYIRHYFTKSYQEWLLKVSRGLADRSDGALRKVNEFY